MKCEILYEDRDILVVQKPAGLATQSGSVTQPDVVSELKGYLAKTTAKQSGKKQGEPYLGVVHRLDQPVEGLLVFGKNSGAAAELTKELSQGGLQKRYYAVVCGKPVPECGELVDYLTKEQNQTARVVTGREKEFPQAKRAVLRYQRIAEEKISDLPGSLQGSISLLDISIGTGRFHQIRAQMAHAGYPLLGDQKYGSEQSLEISRQRRIANVALCAYQLEIRHPSTGRPLSWRIHPRSSAFSMIKV